MLDWEPQRFWIERRSRISVGGLSRPRPAGHSDVFNNDRRPLESWRWHILWQPTSAFIPYWYKHQCIYKATRKMYPLLRLRIYLFRFLLTFMGVIQKVHLDNWHGEHRKLKGKEMANAHVWWNRISWNSLRTKWAARSKRREELACSLEGLLNITSPGALKLPVVHLEASLSLLKFFGRHSSDTSQRMHKMLHICLGCKILKFGWKNTSSVSKGPMLRVQTSAHMRWW